MLKRALPVFLFTIACAVSAWGYESITVNDGGSIKGRVKVSGTIPKDENIIVTKDKNHCGGKLPREKYVISAGGGVKNAVVVLEYITKGKPIPTETVVIDNKHCAFHPHVQTAVQGQTLMVRNSDPMLHNTHLYLNKKTIYNFALPRTGMEIKKPISRVGLIEVECDAHDWMKGYLYVADNPYITVTDVEGNFSIGEIPPGDYEVEVWHEAFGMQEHKVTIGPKERLELSIEYNQ